MGEPRLSVLGVYRPVISAETWHEQWQVSEDDNETKEHFDSLVLIEAVVEGLDEHFEMSRFGQMSALRPDDPNSMLVGYDEGLLSPDGESLMERGMDCVRGTGALRFAVYLHQYDPGRPLLWQGGTVTCPAVWEAPAPYDADAVSRVQLIGVCRA